MTVTADRAVTAAMGIVTVDRVVIVGTVVATGIATVDRVVIAVAMATVTAVTVEATAAGGVLLRFCVV